MLSSHTSKSERRLTKALTLVKDGVRIDRGELRFSESLELGIGVLCTLMPPTAASMLWRNTVWNDLIAPELIRISKAQ